MTSRRAEGFSLREAVMERGFTPRRSDLTDLLSLLDTDDEDLAEGVGRALASLGAEAGRGAMEVFEGARPPARGRLVKLVGRVGAEGGGVAERDFLLRCLSDDDPKSRRNAVVALGRWSGPEVEDALLGYWEREPRGDHRRSVAASLGKAGAARALEHLGSVQTDDGELRRLVDQAVTVLSRSLGRGEVSALEGSVKPPRPMPVELHCRPGLERWLVDELPRAWGARALGPGVVGALVGEAPEALFRARTMTWFGYELSPEHLGPGEDVDRALVRALTSERAREVFETWTRGPARYRVEWAEGGHRRSAVWRSAREVTARCPGVVNDPRESTWEAVVTELGGAVRVVLRPRKLRDPRFEYRRGDVPAASHPTVAAALAWVAGVRDDDVVWDPFVGSGLELAERSLLGPYARLLGTDLDPSALSVARANLDAVGAREVTLLQRDALTYHPRGVTLVITNPPFGHRVGGGTDMAATLGRFLHHVGGVLGAGGRMVWVSPFPTKLEGALARAGLVVKERSPVDLGGMRAELQALWKK